MTYFQAISDVNGMFRGFISANNIEELKQSKEKKYGYIFKALNMSGNYQVTIEGKKTPQRARRIRESEQIRNDWIKQIKNI